MKAARTTNRRPGRRVLDRHNAVAVVAVARLRSEVIVLQTTRQIDEVAERIERAYLRRRPEWRPASLDRRLWSSAAAILLDAHNGRDDVPLDPELFVAAQVRGGLTSDPWMDLTRPRARDLYLGRVSKIVRRLRRELREEIRRAEIFLARGELIEIVLMSPSRRLTALGRYVIAIRQGRRDLADRFRELARDQHRACPLYRSAVKGLIPAEDYPVPETLVSSTLPPRLSPFSIN